jgi:hypothetical protein
VSDGRRNKFHDMLVAGLKDAAGPDTTIITAEEVRFALGDKPSLLDCQEGACLHSVAELVKADRLIVAHITIKSTVGGSAYKIALSVYDQNGTALPTTGTESCGDESEGCNLSRAFDALKRSTASIAGQLSAPATPQNSGPAQGAAPAESQTTEAVSSEPATELPPVRPSPYAKVYHYGWITAAAVTGGFIIASIPFLVYAAKEGDITCGPNVARDQCPTVYTGNLGPGLGLLLGGGLVSAGAFAVLFYLDRREIRRMKRAQRVAGVQFDTPSINFSSEGAAFSLSGRF